ncbi:thiamine-monophosphate kinase [Gracilibacillus ureilyticus]|uniref:Thiamine-monophosphate kinase n=1 Tax=Gracilibacillus ureilyticus TaxID=531814 RepID=A0A1H9VRA4_9BACI|nr:thiamine-phosphate kinase [Gracilibacillus ureilyticus]SES24185.1 thiamine-monophosphate kinase [Gracilibacillus ureilyticus]
MDEFKFIQSITPKYYHQSSIITGIGDDAAIIRQQQSDTVIAMDTMVESVHFSEKTTSPYHIGYRALAANISDIAAMGGKVTAYLVSIVIPKRWDEEKIRDIYRGMNDLAAHFQMDLIGGDTVSGSQLTISITVIGSVKNDQARYRGDAKPGDYIFVTGTLGDSACGLYVLLHGEREEQDEFKYFINRHQMPWPRISFIQECQQIKRMALNDVSDGIANEANEIAEASQLLLELDYEKIPVHQDLRKFPKHQQYNWSLSGGEDFELIGTVPAADWEILEKAAERTKTSITKIGEVKDIKEKNGSAWIYHENQYRKLERSGYTHLKG